MAKNLKTFLKELSLIANTSIVELRGVEQLTDEQQYELKRIVVSVQNCLGDELADILKKNDLQWEG